VSDVALDAGPKRDDAAEVARLNRVVVALMDRAERSTNAQLSNFGLFQKAVTLEAEVRRHTSELEAALRDNEKIMRALRESEARFRGIVSQSLVGIVIIEKGKFAYTNKKFDEIFGYASEEMSRLGPLDLAVDDDCATIAEAMRKRSTGEVDHVHYFFRGRRKDGGVIDVEIYGSVMDVNGNPLWISLVLDVTDRLRAERELKELKQKFQELSIRDPLTGLFNRRYLEEMLTRELAVAERSGQPVSLVMADLDHFKLVNDGHGHTAGDSVLSMCAAILDRNTRVSDICCRYGGEEFLIVLPQMDKKGAVARAEGLRARIADAACGPGQIRVTASFGVATYPDDGRSPQSLIAAADKALYAAKEGGRNRVATS
jgi:diguanylate cyclase (GGDEF)-like protein/PAS domain S-box-containing protein